MPDRVSVIQSCLYAKSIMTVINVYGPTDVRVGANIKVQAKFFCDLAKSQKQSTEPVLSFTSPETSILSWVSFTNRKTS